ncbi:MAG: dihydroorotate dehydrogenase electron transfer subunit [Clostridia bacterium]|nr:dihydroorotate dehydrogenase electron transfer subunit [Clostridia bacterium]
MKQSVFTVIKTRALTASVYETVFSGDTSAITAAGQFVNVLIDGLYLRRPVSVCDLFDGTLTLVYKVVGKGTAKLAAAKAGDKFDMLTGLGNGYDLSRAGEKPLLIGGGAGVPPLYLLAKRLIADGKIVSAVLGFNSAEEVFYESEFAALGVKTVVATADGSRGVKGFATDALPEKYSYFYACGPESMLKAVYAETKTDGEFSFEERMGCGFGACMGCSCKTNFGIKRVCKDGPVFRKGEILWK